MSPERRAEPRWGRRVVLVLGALLVALVFGVTTATVESSLGPHEARYDVTTDDTITVDLGPLGTLRIDSPLPLTLGVHVTVQEIPASVTQLTPAKTLEALSGDLQSYLQFFAGPKATVQDVARALVVDALERAGCAFVVLVGAWWALRLLVGTARWQELHERAEPHRHAALAAGVVVLVAATVLTSSVGADERPVASHPTSPVFDGTPLQGAEVTGRLGGVIDTYGAQVIAELRKNDEFYTKANTSLRVAWDKRQALTDEQDARAAQAAAARSSASASASASESESEGPSPEPSAPAGSPTAPQVAAGSPSGSPAPSSSPAEEPVPDDADLLTVVVISDLHCNVGMAPLITTLVKRSGADLVLDAGDDTLNGTTVEQYCVTTFARAIPKGVKLVTSPGNHDSRETSRLYARAGATVLDGSVLTVDGMRILGDKDPNETRVGAGGTTQATTESAAQEGARLARTACADNAGVDLLLIHTPAVGAATLDRGCSPAQISGHLHKRYGPEPIGQGVRYISSSTAGATLGKPTIGPLNGVAEMTVLRWNPKTRLFVDYQVVQVRPDTTADVWPRLRWPPAEPATAPRS